MALTVAIKTADAAADLAVTFDASRVVLGRGKSADLQLLCPSVSGRHASIRRQGGRTLVVDEGSTNGILIGNVKLPPHTPRAISDGEIVRIGRVWLELRFGGAPSTPKDARRIARELLERRLKDEGAEPVVEVVSGPDRGKTAVLRGTELVIGRGQHTDLQLTDPLASRRHLAVARQGDGFVVRDLGSKRGSLLLDEGGEQALTQAAVALEPGRQVRIGDTVVALVDPLRAALDELATAADEPMDETEWQEPPPGVLVAAPVVEAPSEGVTDDDPEEREPEPRIPIFTPSAMEAPGEGPRGGALDLFVALVALALMAISGLGLAYVLG